MSMRLGFVSVAVAVIGVLAVTVLQLVQPTAPEVLERKEYKSASTTRHRSYSIDASLYAVTASSSYNQRFTSRAAGGIVSHHLLANIDIAHFFAEFTDQSVCRVVILGPNHYFPHDDMVVTTDQGYETPFGIVETDTDLVTVLEEDGLAVIKSDTIEEEHSISSLVPYIAAYFPNATVVPLILNQKYDEGSLRQLADVLVKQSNDCTIVVASVDFSHHLYSNMSDLHDRRSIAALTQFDIASYRKLEVDSRSALAVASMYFDARGMKQLEVQRQSSANIFKQYDSEDVTSYVFAHAIDGDRKVSQGVSVLYYGDMMLGRGVSERSGLWSGISGPEGNFMKGYDGVVGNIEGALLRDSCPADVDDLYITTDILRTLRIRGVTHGGVMNNHFLRCPIDDEARQIFTQSDLVLVSDQSEVIKGTNKDIVTTAVYASPVPADTAAIVEKFAAVPDDVVSVAYLHWGNEYTDIVGERERALAHALIDAGVDAIVGHHPHVTQPVEVYKNAPIFYSLGNLFSDQVGRATQTGFAVGVWGGLNERLFYIYPYSNDGSVPTHMTQYEARSFCEDVYQGDAQFVSPLHPCILQFHD